MEEFCELHEKKMEKVERKRKTDRDLYDVEVVVVDTTRKQLKIHFLGFSHKYDEYIYRRKLTIEKSDVSATSWRHCQGKIN